MDGNNFPLFYLLTVNWNLSAVLTFPQMQARMFKNEGVKFIDSRNNYNFFLTITIYPIFISVLANCKLVFRLELLFTVICGRFSTNFKFFMSI